jgi:hypothetical protein
MTTAEFIKMLQEEDPEGTAHIRMGGGVPYGAESKAGYWDGPYSYIDKDGNWVYSSEGTKVDIYCREIDDFVHDMMDTYEKPPWEEIESRFKFKLTYANEAQRKERENGILRIARESYDSTIDMYERFKNEGESRALDRFRKGWKWFQNKEVDNPDIEPNLHHYYTWIVLDENGKDQGSNPHNVEAVYKSGMFERLDNGKRPGYYEWVMKSEK